LHHRIAWPCFRLRMLFDDHPAHTVEKCRLRGEG
jgi:hypothetical protein